MPKELTVTKHNGLIEASYKLNLNEQRLILLCISKIDPRRPMPIDNCFTVTAKEFSLMFKIDEKSSYKEIEKASKMLAERWIKTYDGKYKERFRWVFGIRYHENEGKITLAFSPWIHPYLTKLHKHFTSYKLNQITGLRSIYSIRILEFLIQFKSTGRFVIDLDKLRERLELKNEYTRFYDFKIWVIEKSLNELREKSNFHIDWKPIKSGKVIKQIEFIFKEKFD